MKKLSLFQRKNFFLTRRKIKPFQQIAERESFVNREEIFVGREEEIQLFQQTLKKLYIESDQRGGYVVLVHGIGGMGKSTLCAQFMKIATSEYPKLEQVTVDWDRGDKRFGLGFTREELLDAVARELSSIFFKETAPYFNAKEGFKKEQEELEQISKTEGELIPPVEEMVDEIEQNKYRGILSIIVKALNVVIKMRHIRRIKRIKKLDRRFLIHPDRISALSQCLRDCINTITNKKKKKLLLILDTCELIGQHEEWFLDNFLVPLVDKNPNIMLIFAGRHNSYTQRSIIIDGKLRKVRGFKEKMKSHHPQQIGLRSFDRHNIEEFLRKFSADLDLNDQTVGFVHSFSRGVPLAVDLLADILEKLGVTETLHALNAQNIEQRFRERITNEEVVREVAETFISYCLTDQDRNRIFSLAVLDDIDLNFSDDIDLNLLKTLWQIDNPGDVLQELKAKYALFVGFGKKQRLHSIVRKFLSDYLLEDESLRLKVKPIIEQTVSVYRAEYEEQCRKEPNWEKRFQETRWREATQKLINALVWNNPTETTEAIDFFLKRSIELLLIDPSFIHTLRQPLERVFTFENFPKKEVFEMLESFNWNNLSRTDEEELVSILSCCQNIIQEWNIESVHEMILRIVQGRIQYYQNNHEDALQLLLSYADETILDNAITARLAEALDDIGVKLCNLEGEPTEAFFSGEALAIFEKIVQLNGQESVYWYHLGVMIYLKDESQEALAFHFKSLELNQQNAYVFLSLGNIYNTLKEYDKAVEAFFSASQLRPDLLSPYICLGHLCQNLGNYNKAIEAYSRASQLDHESAVPCIGLGNCYTEMENFDEAIEEYARAKRLAPKSIEPHIALAELYNKTGDYTKAIEVYSEAKQLDPKSVDPYIGLGNTYQKLKDYEQAISMYREAEKLDSEHVEVLNKLGVVYQKLGRSEIAIEKLQKAREIDPECKYTCKNLGDIFFQEDKFTDAKEMYKKAIEIDPEYTEAMERFLEISRGSS